MTDDVPSLQSRASSLESIIRDRGPLTVAAFMDLALYHPEFGYYARAGQRSGRAGDFFTSVDVGPLFGELLEIQFEQMWRILSEARGSGLEVRDDRPSSLDLVEAGAGNGRLSADVLRAARDRHPAFYERVRLHLIEASATARASQRDVLGDVADRLVSSAPVLPESFEGVLFANELLDAMPVHQVVMREDGLREVFVECRGPAVSGAARGGAQPPAVRLIEREPSTSRLAEYLDRAGVTLDVGARAEIGLAAVDWMRDAARRLRRGFIVLIDYGHEARELYSAAHANGTLTSFSRHTMAGSETAVPIWIIAPGEQDITAHVDFTSVRAAAETEGCVTLGLLDQTYFLMGIVESAERAKRAQVAEGGDGAMGATGANGDALLDPKRARALKTLIMPGGLGSTQKVLVLAKNVGAPALIGCSFRMRLT